MTRTAQAQDTCRHVESADGRRVTSRVVGAGPPLLVLPGAMNGAESWAAVADVLAAEFTVWPDARRNYPPSGAGPGPNSFAAEVADVAALLAAAGGRAHVAGHSYGGLVALHAALADPSGIRSLLLYEPPVSAPGPYAADVLRRYRQRLATGDPAGAIGLFLSEVARLPEEIPAMLGGDPAGPSPAGGELRALVGSLLHDLEAIAADRADVRRWSGIAVPTLLMSGALSWDPLPDDADALAGVLPDVEHVVWAGQSHFANATAPELLAGAIREFTAQQG